MVVPYGVRPYVGAACNDVLNYMQCLPGQTPIVITAFRVDLIKINVDCLVDGKRRVKTSTGED